MNAIALRLPWRRVMSEVQPVWRCQRCSHWEPRYERAVNTVPICPFCCPDCSPGMCNAREGVLHGFGKYHPVVHLTEAVRRTDVADPT